MRARPLLLMTIVLAATTWFAIGMPATASASEMTIDPGLGVPNDFPQQPDTVGTQVDISLGADSNGGTDNNVQGVLTLSAGLTVGSLTGAPGCTLTSSNTVTCMVATIGDFLAHS